MRAVDPLHGQTKRRGSPVFLDLDALEVLEQMGSLIPGRTRASRGHVVAEARGNRDGVKRAKPEQLRKLAIVDDDVAKDPFVVADEIDLVDREHHMPHAQE